METLKLLGIMFLIVVGVITTQTYLSYQHDIRAARERVMTGSQVIETACGTIEYATMGEGPPVLVVHGAGVCITPSRSGFSTGVGIGGCL
ncbi:MAG: hypothetical protein WA130_05090 [Candidatus Methanoperedens sp.]